MRQLSLFDEETDLPLPLPMQSLEETPVRRQGRFITIEGGEGAGKSTQAELLEQRLVDANFSVLLLREPGSTALGAYVRNWVKRETRTSVMAETFLFEAARAELVKRIIRPAMKREMVVICDRFSDSSIAYQGYGRRMKISTIEMLNRIACDGLVPDLTVLLTVPHDRGLARVENKTSLLDTHDLMPTRIDLEEARRFESAPSEFHARVHEGFSLMAAQDPVRWRIVDGTQTVETIADEVWGMVKEKLGLTYPLPFESAIA